MALQEGCGGRELQATKLICVASSFCKISQILWSGWLLYDVSEVALISVHSVIHSMELAKKKKKAKNKQQKKPQKVFAKSLLLEHLLYRTLF